MPGTPLFDAHMPGIFLTFAVKEYNARPRKMLKKSQTAQS
jgi:hypothetical protein